MLAQGDLDVLSVAVVLSALHATTSSGDEYRLTMTTSAYSRPNASSMPSCSLL
jgi:hypothetical protein